MKADQLLSDEQRSDLEFLANHSTMRCEVRNGKRVWVDTYRHGPNKGKEFTMPDYITNSPRKTTKDPSIFEQVVLAGAMLIAGILIYLCVLGL